ncbi:MAG TPA: hypothetical protein V6C76_02250 [Drouetiella sp.]
MVLYLPVLLHAHWGTFDDPSLILQSSRRLMDDPTTVAYILAAQMRMGIFYWVTVLWRLFPENPTGFFATNCLLISTALALTYFTTFKLTNNPKLSCMTTSLALASPSLFEVIYTLDKQENYFPFLFSAVILFHIIIGNCKKWMILPIALLAGVLATGSYLSKETGIILSVLSGTFLVANLLWADRQRREICFRFGLIFVAVTMPYVILKYAIFPVINDKYVVVTFDLAKLLTKTIQYALVVPEFFVSLIGTLGGALALSFSKVIDKNSQEWCAFVALLFSSLAATAALISFDTFAGTLVYIWLPIYFLLLPAFGYVLVKIPTAFGQKGKLFRTLFLSLFAILLIGQIPSRFLQAQFQFSFDSMTSELSDKLAEISKVDRTPTIAALPTYSVGETEVPEQIETHVRSRLTNRYYETKTEKIDGQQFTMLNYLSPICSNVHEPGDPPDVFRLALFRGKGLTYRNLCAQNYVGWTGYQILNGATPFQEWVKRPFGKGSLLVIPYGEATPDTILYRGSGMFAHPWKLKTMNFPQFSFDDIAHVERKLTYIGHHRQTIGWRILRVTDAAPVALATSSDGWLKNSAPIFCENTGDKPILVLESKQPGAQVFVAKFENKNEQVILPAYKDNGFSVSIRIPHKSEAEQCTLEGFDGARLHVDRAFYKADAKNETPPYVCKTFDNWILQNGYIIYSKEQSGKVLQLITDQKSADVQLKTHNSISELKPAQGIFSIKLVDGEPIANDLFYLQLRSNQPLASSTEKRQLLIHCVSTLMN